MHLRNFFSKSGASFRLKTNGLSSLVALGNPAVFPIHECGAFQRQIRFRGAKAVKQVPQSLRGTNSTQLAPAWGLANLLKRKKTSGTKDSNAAKVPTVGNKPPRRKVLTVYAPKPIPQRRENLASAKSTELTPTYFKELKSLPVYLIKNEQQLEKAMNLLISTFSNSRGKRPYVGFDTEHPNSGKVAVVQFANDQIALVIQLRFIMENNGRVFPKSLKDLLENKKILKVGVNSTGDAVSLERAYQIQCKGIRNIEDLARETGLERQGLGLKRLSIECRIGMGVIKQSTVRKQWNAQTLLKSEILYAVKDALASYRIFSRLLNNPGGTRRNA
ncbi:ribonuclease H-like protein [Basidiobolus meristosporus CBS 931.73]|uniref:3'-5' exonuclease n=1 Tax=Basidiobolus meristosporus CBS 931.73 TaxID=1314790 RepID=A0A1Y1XTQ4_9FUNG|nr:ribonuclease H-like protein [Basidiobolus meristosporus CBS 931.73]|eukprot:ORX89065.1 ribonuclease H-like protein [Basidiobolus meristosporus CBS 931.73]